MDARIDRRAVRRAAKQALLGVAVLWVSMGARARGPNFIVDTADPTFAQQVVQTAEKYRHDLAIEWLGEAMPDWAQPCVMTVQAGPQLGAGGATTFKFDRGEVYDWVMVIQGSRERILDSVLPHEITHMIFASHFRQPLPRWADEGGATTIEHFSEKNKHRQALGVYLRTNRGIAFNQMFAMTEYPQDIMPLYAQGYSLAEFLIQTGGRRKFVTFLGDGLKSEDWSGAVERHYGIHDLGALQNTWLAWVRQGSPAIVPRNAGPAPAGELLASNDSRPRPEPNLIYHVRDGQSANPPAGNLVPVRVPNLAANRSSVASARSSAGSVPASSSQSQAEQMAAVDVSHAQVLPASGWHSVGAPATDVASLAASSTTASSSPSDSSWQSPSSSVEPIRTQVTHPLAIEPLRQTVVR